MLFVFIIAAYYNQFETLIWAIIAGIILNIIIFGINNYSQEGNERKKYFEVYKEAKDIKPEDFRIAKFNKYYFMRAEDNEILKEVELNDNILIIGKPKIGKSRAAYESIKKQDSYNVIKFWEKPIKFDEIPDYIFKGRNIVFLDDINNFVEKLNFYELLKNLKRNKDSFIVATCRTGDELELLENIFPDITNFKVIELEIIETKTAKEIAKTLNISFNEKYYDGTPGSLILDLNSMKTRYNGFPNECKIIFRQLKLLHTAGITLPYARLLKELTIKTIKEQNLLISLDFETALKKLVSNSLLTMFRNKEQIISVVHESYFEFESTEFNIHDFKGLQQILVKDNDLIGIFILGNSFLFKNFYKEALENYDIILEVNKAFSPAWNNKGTVLSKLGKNEEAVESFDKALEINPKYADAWYNKGTVLNKLGKSEEAVESFDKALEINPESTSAWYNKGISLCDLKEYNKAINSYDKALEINPNLISPLNNKGIALRKLGKPDEAIKCFDKALEINPNDVFSLNNKGLAYDELGKPNEAIKCFDKALEINPLHASAWYNKGMVLNKIGEDVEAIKDYDKALEINPKYLNAWFNRGNTFGVLKEYEKAIESYDKALEINPEFSDALTCKGGMLIPLKRYKSSLECLKKALEINPNDFVAKKNIETIKKLFDSNQKNQGNVNYVMKKWNRKQ